MKVSRMHMRKLFAMTFVLFVILPLLIAFFFLIDYTYNEVREDAIGNIRLFHSTIKGMLEDEERSVSARLSHLMYVDNNSIPSAAILVDTDGIEERHAAAEALDELLDYTLPPLSEILSVRFVYKSGRWHEYKSDLNLALPLSVIDEAAADPDNIKLTALRAGSYPSMYQGNTDDNLIWLSLISPSLMIDRSGGISYVALFQISSVYQTILNFDTAYSLGHNNIGYTAIIDREKGSILSASRIDRKEVQRYLDGEEVKGMTFITTPLSSSSYEILTQVRSRDLLSGYGGIFVILLLVIAVLLFSLLLFMYLIMKSVINPVKGLSDGLRAVEMGNLEQHIDPEGPREVRDVIHSFNAMVRRIRAMVRNYEDEINLSSMRPEVLMKGYISSSLSHEDEILFARKYLSSEYRLLLVHLEKRTEIELFITTLDQILHFSSSALCAAADEKNFIIHYRRDSEGGHDVYTLADEIFRCISSIMKSEGVILISDVLSDPQAGAEVLAALHSAIPIMPLLREGKNYEVGSVSQLAREILPLSLSYSALSCALLSADERNLSHLRQEMSSNISSLEITRAKAEVLSLILSLSMTLEENGSSLHELLGYTQDYPMTVNNITEKNQLLLFISNLLTQAEDQVLQELDLDNLDPVSRARRYIADNYQNPNLSLSDVAEYAGLNEKYFSTLFTKSAGETFMSYLTGLRIQNAKSLLRKTTFKVYEISAMCGYSNPEHFIRTFRKVTGSSPNNWRNMTKDQGI